MDNLTCSVGVFAHNEENNIGNILDALLKQKCPPSPPPHLHEGGIDEIIVISSGSTDNTNLIVKDFVRKYDKIKLFIEPVRRGKSSAINLFIEKARNDILVVISADTIPKNDAIEKLIRPLANHKIGMTGGRPVPVNKTDNFLGFAVNLLWKLHHRLAIFQPKLGEMIAFKKIFNAIPLESAVDEASIEAVITKAGLKCLYVSDAIVYNKGPETLTDFIKQRKRICIGHLWLKDNQNYNVASNKLGLLLSLYISECFRNPKNIIYITGLVKLEIYSRMLGYLDYYIKKKNPFIWETIKTTKKIK